MKRIFLSFLFCSMLISQVHAREDDSLQSFFSKKIGQLQRYFFNKKPNPPSSLKITDKSKSLEVAGKSKSIHKEILEEKDGIQVKKTIDIDHNGNKRTQLIIENIEKENKNASSDAKREVDNKTDAQDLTDFFSDAAKTNDIKKEDYVDYSEQKSAPKTQYGEDSVVLNDSGPNFFDVFNDYMGKNLKDHSNEAPADKKTDAQDLTDFFSDVAKTNDIKKEDYVDYSKNKNPSIKLMPEQNLSIIIGDDNGDFFTRFAKEIAAEDGTAKTAVENKKEDYHRKNDMEEEKALLNDDGKRIKEYYGFIPSDSYAID